MPKRLLTEGALFQGPGTAASITAAPVALIGIIA